MKKLSKTICIGLIKKGLNTQEVLTVLDEAKALIKVGINFERCQQCNAPIFDDDAIYCFNCGNKITN